MWFQFHKGSIRTVIILHVCKVITMFQFHKGSIRTIPPFKYVFVSELFQFHKGSIRTTASSRKPRLGRSFNSIKVQLERGAVVPLLVERKFQFHKGSIRTDLF